jgi:hypothetical protein
MARLKSSIRRINDAATTPLGSRVSSDDRSALFLSATRSRRAMRIDKNPATAPNMNAGAVACEIATLS